MATEQIEKLLQSWCLDLGAPGASAGVRCMGGFEIVAAWGCDGRDPISPMSTAAKFRIGSVTKTFTSALVLDLVDRGDLSLDATVDRWLPQYPLANEISIRSLLTHTAGTADLIVDAFDDYLQLLLADLQRRFTPDEVVDLTASLAPHHAPGESYRYSNTDYQLLGLIAERVSGDNFATLVDRRFASRLGLIATAYDDSVPTDLMHGWFDLNSNGLPGPSLQRDLDVREFPNTALITSAFAAGGMTSTLADLLSWAQSLYLGDALRPAQHDQLLSSPIFEDPTGGHHGFGVFGYGQRAPDGSWTAYGHTGNIIGSSTFYAAFPSTGTVVAAHTNVQEASAAQQIELGFALAALGTSDE